MATLTTLTQRDRAVLELLDRTPATTRLIAKASSIFDGGPFRDPRRVRERLQTLQAFGLVKSFSVARALGGPEKWYKLTPEAFRIVHGPDAELPHRSRFEAISPSRFDHVQTLTEIIVHALVAAHRFRVQVTDFRGDGGVILEFGDYTQVPDCYFQFTCSGRTFNIVLEIDNGTEPLNANRLQSIRNKLLGYERYQDYVLSLWKQNGSLGQTAYFRVVFLTRSAERANHILWLARECASNQDRHLCYAGTQDTFLASEDALRSPLFNDHQGNWQSLVHIQPTAKYLLTPIRLSPPRVSFLGV